MKRMPLIVSFLLFIALCASIAYWGLQLFKPPTRPVAAPPRAVRSDVSPDDAVALFGGRPGKVAAASNYQLKGVILSGTAGDSVAILSADGKPAQAVGVGTEVVPGVTVKEVHREYVLLSDSGAVKRVDLPENAKMQVSIASTAPAGAQQGAGTSPSPARNTPVAPPPQPVQTPATAPAATPATSPGQTPTARSPLLPPPAPQAQQQGQSLSQSQTAPAVPARVVVSPSPTAQTASPPAAPAQPAAPAPAATMAAPGAAPQPTPPTSAPSDVSGEMRPPPSLQSR